MNIALLASESVFRDWFADAYPGVQVWGEVQEDWRALDLILIKAYYRTSRGYVQIRQLWQRRIEQDSALRKSMKLGVIGWANPGAQYPNYLSVFDPPADLEAWGARAQPFDGRGKPTFPDTAHADALPLLSSILKTHGMPFQQLLLRAKDQAARIEHKGPAAPGWQDLMSAFDTTMVQLRGIWERNRDLFALMPQFPKLRSIEPVLEACMAPGAVWLRQQPAISARLIGYITEVLNPILLLYNMR